MADPSSQREPGKPAHSPHDYVVVARRYRPQEFAELVGQEHIARALSNAISSHRVGHAYLFTGARGVGKTSTARILAKALNCVNGPTPSPCNQCDTCRSVSSGDDVDVLEIDGASNRGIDEIRQLRQNANIRPSRSRFKIYIIDEVHMLTREAFNALLKTLEEPPEHVKFIFCTTEATKIPITILSRCQRFDFAGILPGSISARLRQIVEAEGVEAEPEALEILARRAAGSMRDAQSLLEQLLSFAPGRITVADVHGMLGTAGEERLAMLVQGVVAHQPAEALVELNRAIHEGVDAGLLVEQLFGYFRDCLLAATGCPPETFLYASPGSGPTVTEIGRRVGVDGLMAAMQILDQTLSRMRYSTQARILAELALVRISRLEELEEIATLLGTLRQGTGPGPSSPRTSGPPTVHPAGSGHLDSAEAKKKAAVAPILATTEPTTGAAATQAAALQLPGLEAAPTREETGAAQAAGAQSLTAENAAALWDQVLAGMSGMAVEQAKHYERVASSGPNHLEVYFAPAYTFAKSMCELPAQLARFEQALAGVIGEEARVEFCLSDAPPPAAAAAPARIAPQQRLMQVAQHPMVRLAAELLGANPFSVAEPAPGNKEAG